MVRGSVRGRAVFTAGPRRIGRPPLPPELKVEHVGRGQKLVRQRPYCPGADKVDVGGHQVKLAVSLKRTERLDGWCHILALASLESCIEWRSRYP